MPSFLGWCGLKLLLVSSSRSAPWTQDSADEDLGLGLSPPPHSTSVLAELLSRPWSALPAASYAAHSLGRSGEVLSRGASRSSSPGILSSAGLGPSSVVHCSPLVSWSCSLGSFAAVSWWTPMCTLSLLAPLGGVVQHALP